MGGSGIYGGGGGVGGGAQRQEGGGGEGVGGDDGGGDGWWQRRWRRRRWWRRSHTRVILESYIMSAAEVDVRIFENPDSFQGIVGVARASSQQGTQCCPTHGKLEKHVSDVEV